MDLFSYVRLLRRRWAVLATSVLLALVVAALTTAWTSPVYAASITLVVSAPDSSGAPSAYQAVLASRERAKSYADLIRSRSVTAEVARALGNGLTADELRRRISAEALPDTVLLRATVTDGAPAQAMQIAHTLGVQFAHYVDGLERSAPNGRPSARITVADDAELPTTPVRPSPSRNLALGLAAGLVAGIAAAVLRDLTDTSVRSVPSLYEAAGSAALGVIGIDRRLDDGSLIISDDSPQAAAFDLLRANLQFTGDDLPRSVVVTSPLPGEGTSMVACNLAVSLAKCGRRVILADANLGDPCLADYLHIEDSPGLSDILSAGRPVGDALNQWGPGTLFVLPSGTTCPNPSALLASPTLPTVLRELEDHADIVVFDTPPVLSRTDAAILARRCTGTLLIARHGRTRRAHVSEAVRRLETVQASVLGTVLNFARPASQRFTGHDAPRLPELLERRRVAVQR